MKLPKIRTTGLPPRWSESLTTSLTIVGLEDEVGGRRPEVRTFEHRADVAVEDHLEPVHAVGERGEPGSRSFRVDEQGVAEIVVGEMILPVGHGGEECLPFLGGDLSVTVGIDHVESAAPLPCHLVPGRPLRPVEIGRGDRAIVVAVQPVPGRGRSRELGAEDRAVPVAIEPGGEPLPGVARDAGMIPAAGRGVRTRCGREVGLDLFEQLGHATGADGRSDGLPEAVRIDRVESWTWRGRFGLVGRRRGNAAGQGDQDRRHRDGPGS